MQKKQLRFRRIQTEIFGITDVRAQLMVGKLQSLADETIFTTGRICKLCNKYKTYIIFNRKRFQNRPNFRELKSDIWKTMIGCCLVTARRITARLSLFFKENPGSLVI